MVELDHPITTARPVDESWKLVLDLERLIPCVQGGTVLEKTGDESVKAEIKVKMGAMSMKFTGTVSVEEQDPDHHRALLKVKAREAGGTGHANADVTFTLEEGGGNLHTAAQITGKAASMGEGMVSTVLDALITDFVARFGEAA
ncbi:MAG: SRPBCC family protein [Solirubrobacteraceae bacterium]